MWWQRVSFLPVTHQVVSSIKWYSYIVICKTISVFQAGFDESGKIKVVEVELFLNAGYTTNCAQIIHEITGHLDSGTCGLGGDKGSSGQWYVWAGGR